MRSTSLPPAFHLLAGERNLAVDAALADVLPLLDGERRSAAWDMLVRRGHDPTLATIVARFGSFNRSLQSQIVARAPSLLGAVRMAIEAPDIASRAGAIAVIVHSGCGPLIYLLSDALRSRDERTRRLAGAGLCRVCERFLDDPARGRSKRGEKSNAGKPACWSAAAHVGESLCRAVHLWEIHRQRKIIESALWFSAGTMPAIRKKLDETRSDLGRVLIEFLSDAPDPRLAEFTIRALAIPKLQSAAASAIAAATKPAFIRVLLDHTWLLADPDIEKGCRRIQRIGWIDDRPELLGDAGDHDGQSAVRWIVSGGGSSSSKVARLGELLCIHRPALSRAVLRHLLGDCSQEATDMLGIVATRFSGDWERRCRRELRRRRGEMSTPESGTASPTGSPDRDVRSLFTTYWDCFDLPDAEDRAPLREQLLLRKAALPALVRARLAFGDPTDRLRALGIIHALGLAGDMAETLYRSAYDPDPAVRGCVVSLLGDLQGPTSLRILRQAVNDPDERVQANAIEVLDRWDWPERTNVTKPKLQSRHNRVRANAIKSLLRLEIHGAGDALLDMLEDSSSRHRLSAIWVVESAGLESLSQRMALMSRADSDELVRQRAAVSLESLGHRQENRKEEALLG